MKNTKFVVKVNRGSTRATEYVQRIDPTPIQMTPIASWPWLWGDSQPKTLSNRSKTPGAARN